MHSVSLVLFDSVSDMAPVWINPARVTFIHPRFRGRTVEDVVGTRIDFGPEQLLDVVQMPQVVVARLEGRLPEPWRLREDKNGVDADYEAALAELRP